MLMYQFVLGVCVISLMHQFTPNVGVYCDILQYVLVVFLLTRFGKYSGRFMIRKRPIRQLVYQGCHFVKCCNIVASDITSFSNIFSFPCGAVSEVFLYSFSIDEFVHLEKLSTMCQGWTWNPDQYSATAETTLTHFTLLKDLEKR